MKTVYIKNRSFYTESEDIIHHIQTFSVRYTFQTFITPINFDNFSVNDTGINI